MIIATMIAAILIIFILLISLAFGIIYLIGACFRSYQESKIAHQRDHQQDYQDRDALEAENEEYSWGHNIKNYMEE